MRVLAGLAVVLSFVAPAAAKSSNPAFLGVGMNDLSPRGPCQITMVTPNTAASEAGLRFQDVFVAMDGQPIDTCSALQSLIQAREPGQLITIDVRRDNQLVSVKAQLLTRAELLRRRFVGQVLPPAEVARFTDTTDVDLAAPGQTTIVGWFESRCVECKDAFGPVERWARKRKATRVFAATRPPSSGGTAQLKPLANALDVPLLVAEDDTYERFSITDVDRVFFMVIDCRGIVSYVAPIAPDADDLDAALDELYAAAEQASRRMK